MNDWQAKLRHLAATTALAGMSVPATAIPPHMPAQIGSKVSSYRCGSETLVVAESWDRQKTSSDTYTIRVSGRKLSAGNAQRVDQEIALGGPFQNNFAYCTRSGFNLTLYRYTPTAAKLHLVFKGPVLTHVGLANASTDHKLAYKPVP